MAGPELYYPSFPAAWHTVHHLSGSSEADFLHIIQLFLSMMIILLRNGMCGYIICVCLEVFKGNYFSEY